MNILAGYNRIFSIINVNSVEIIEIYRFLYNRICYCILLVSILVLPRIRNLSIMTTIFIFRACFENTDIQQSKTIIKELAAYIGAGDANDAQTALNILSALAAEHLDKLKPVASMLRVCTWSFSFIL